MENLFHTLNSHQPAQSPRQLHISLMEYHIPTPMLKPLKVDFQLLLMKLSQPLQDILLMSLFQLQREPVLTLTQSQPKLLLTEPFHT
jgi:hypothetical protein